MKEEQTKTAPLEEVCAALREDLDIQHKKRMESFETKMKPIIIKEGPSKKVISNIFDVLLILRIILYFDSNLILIFTVVHFRPTTKLLLQNYITKYML